MYRDRNSVASLVMGWLVMRLLLVLAVVTITFSFTSSALAMTQSIELNSTQGYKVETIFSYDEQLVSAPIKEQGFGKTKALDSMEVSFYNPAGKLLATYKNVINGIAQGNYFEFNFDPTTQRLLGNIDLGGEFRGEMYLKGSVEKGLALIEVEATGEEKAIDWVNQ